MGIGSLSVKITIESNWAHNKPGREVPEPSYYKFYWFKQKEENIIEMKSKKKEEKNLNHSLSLKVISIDKNVFC